MTNTDRPLLSVAGLSKSFASRGRSLAAVDDISFTLARGETLALVGPSGSGKSTLARIIMRLVEADAGQILFDGSDLLRLRGSALRKQRRRFQMVFQDPLAAFNPRATIERVLGDPLRIHGIKPRGARAEMIGSLLDRVGLADALRHRRVHEISGGQRQRVAIARALATSPDFIVLDEALSALDVSVRAQIVQLLVEVQKSSGVAYLFISHDLALVQSFADRVAILDAGKIVETSSAHNLIAAPISMMGRALVSAIPTLPSFERTGNERWPHRRLE